MAWGRITPSLSPSVNAINASVVLAVAVANASLAVAMALVVSVAVLVSVFFVLLAGGGDAMNIAVIVAMPWTQDERQRDYF